MKVTLQEWNEQYFARPRSKRMLYKYISSGKIYPAPVKIGKEYEIEESAILVDNQCLSDQTSLMVRINEQKEKVRKSRSTAVPVS